MASEETKSPPPPKAPAKPPGPAYKDISDDPGIGQLKSRFGDAIEEATEFLGQQIVRVSSSRLPDVLRFLKDDSGMRFDFLSDLTAVHYPEKPRPLEIVYHLYSFPRNARLRVKCSLADHELLESACSLWGTANWLEREVYDLFGVRFEHHPDLRRILLPPDWDGHPLRKEHTLEYQENDWVRRHLDIRDVHPETDQTGKFEMTEFVKANR
jgi:NADH-quinone oxidoreductase subunit C